MSQGKTENPKAFIVIIRAWVAIAAVAWVFRVLVEIVDRGAKLHHVAELAPAFGVLIYFVWRYDLVGTPKR